VCLVPVSTLLHAHEVFALFSRVYVCACMYMFVCACECVRGEGLGGCCASVAAFSRHLASFLMCVRVCVCVRGSVCKYV